MEKIKVRYIPPTIAALALLLQGCSELDCVVSGDNVIGRVNYTDRITRSAGSDIVVEGSRDNFSTIHHKKVVSNRHELVTIPYTLCIKEDSNTRFRAFQDADSDGVYDDGEAFGRYDQTSNGNSDYIEKSAPSAAADDEGRVLRAIDIDLDSSTSS